MNAEAKERRALARGRTLGRAFFCLLFLAFEKKVSRRKGETLSGRYRSNGYVPGPPHPGRLSGRLRWQASSYSGSGMAVGDGWALRTLSLASQLLQWIGYGRGRWVGFEDAFAGKPVPTVDRVWQWEMGGL